MTFLNDFTSKLNFKKIVVWYLVLGMIAGIAATSFLGYTYREKIAFAFGYHNIAEQMESNQTPTTQELQTRISDFSSRYQSIVDIIILDNSNRITYSAKHSELATKDTFTLTPRNNREHGVLVLSENPKFGFKVVDEEGLVWGSLFEDRANEYDRENKSETFFEPEFHHKAIYMLSYLVDEQTGERIYFIQDNTPVNHGTVALKIVAAVVALFFMIYWVLLALWVYEHARREKLNAPLWGIVTLFSNLAGLFIFLLYRQSGTICKSCGTLQSKGNSYCFNCGSQLSESCSHCGKMVGTHDKYCPSCGKAVEKSDS